MKGDRSKAVTLWTFVVIALVVYKTIFGDAVGGLLLGVIKPTPEVQEAMNFGLLCRTCVDNCPTKVQTDEAMRAIRQYLAQTAQINEDFTAWKDSVTEGYAVKENSLGMRFVKTN